MPAHRRKITSSEHVRTAADSHSRDLAATRSSPGCHAKKLCRVTKQFIVANRLSVEIASRLPAAKRQEDLGKYDGSGAELLTRMSIYFAGRVATIRERSVLDQAGSQGGTGSADSRTKFGHYPYRQLTGSSSSRTPAPVSNRYTRPIDDLL